MALKWPWVEGQAPPVNWPRIVVPVMLHELAQRASGGRFNPRIHLWLDGEGNAKLGDFGIAQAYESVCGVDGRRYVACNGEPQSDSSGYQIVIRIGSPDEHKRLSSELPGLKQLDP